MSGFEPLYSPLWEPLYSPLYSQGLNPSTRSWIETIEANGSSVNADSVALVDFINKELDALGVLSEFLVYYPFVGNNLTAARVPVRISAIGNSIATDGGGMSASSYSQSSGVSPNGTSDYWGTGITPNLIDTNGFGGLIAYVKTAGTTGTDYIIGIRNTVSGLSCALRDDFRCNYGAETNPTIPPSAGVGQIGLCATRRASATDLSTYINGVFEDDNTTSDTLAAGKTDEFFLFARSLNGSASGFSDAQVQFIAFTTGGIPDALQDEVYNVIISAQNKVNRG